MSESTTIIAFDPHAQSVMAAVLGPREAEPAVYPVGSDLPTIGRFVKRLVERGPVRCCYEAGPCGFALQRFLASHDVPCEVIAPTLIPRRPGDRIKTDRRDARQLAILYRAGALTPIPMPSELEEATRDVRRCREASNADLLGARHRLSTFLLRHDRRYTQPKYAWGPRHTAWRRSLPWPLPALEHTWGAYLRAVEETATRLAILDEELRGYFTSEPFAEPVRRLRCFRGISDLGALTIAAELGDARRFPTAPRVMGLVGLVPSEHSSGSRPRARRDHEDGQRPLAAHSARSRVALSASSARRAQAAKAPAWRAAAPREPCLGRAASIVSDLSAPDRPRPAAAGRRHRGRARAGRVYLGHAGVVI